MFLGSLSRQRNVAAFWNLAGPTFWSPSGTWEGDSRLLGSGGNGPGAGSPVEDVCEDMRVIARTVPAPASNINTVTGMNQRRKRPAMRGAGMLGIPSLSAAGGII